jgi:Protein of unknown function (DUF1688)
VKPEAAVALSLLSVKAVRQRADRLLAIGLDDGLAHFRIDPARLSEIADLVIETTRRAYPALDVPLHARWRHFVVGGDDRWAKIDLATAWSNKAERARAAFDLAIVSVLMDAGAGAAWTYRDAATGVSLKRSEGLALAGLAMFASGALSSEPQFPLRADARGLQALTTQNLARALQVHAGNPLTGLQGRAALLRSLGAAVAAQPEVFGRADTPRPGGLFDHLAGLADGGRLPAPVIVRELLTHLAPIWPSRLTLGGVALGDCWRHPAMQTDDASSGFVPLHKLTQWLAYSLIEPLRAADIEVIDVDGLTGLAEYRNGGLFIDAGALALRDATAAQAPHDVGSVLIVEWRGLTVALLDRLAPIVRQRLGMDAASFPLAKLLQGGTWAAGRALACKLRPDASPPLRVISDGTVF